MDQLYIPTNEIFIPEKYMIYYIVILVIILIILCIYTKSESFEKDKRSMV